MWNQLTSMSKFIKMIEIIIESKSYFSFSDLHELFSPK